MYKLLCGRYRNEHVIALAFKIIALDLRKNKESRGGGYKGSEMSAVVGGRKEV